MMFKIVSMKRWQAMEDEITRLRSELSARESELSVWKKGRDFAVRSMEQAENHCIELEARHKRLCERLVILSKCADKLSQQNRHYEAEIERLKRL